MPTLAMYTRPIHAGGWHNVTAPGGYEWRRFYARDAAADLHVRITLGQGSPVDPVYLQAYARYGRSPTRCQPPSPAAYPRLEIAVYRGGSIWRRHICRYMTEAFSAAGDSPAIEAGPNRVRPLSDARGTLQVAVCADPARADHPQHKEGDELTMDLTFAPRFVPVAQSLTTISQTVARAEHHWILSAPACDVVGTIGYMDERIAFRGLGVHDHIFGTAPFTAGLRFSRWEYMVDSNRSLVSLETMSTEGIHQVHRFHATADGVASCDAQATWPSLPQLHELGSCPGWHHLAGTASGTAPDGHPFTADVFREILQPAHRSRAGNFMGRMRNRRCS